MERLTESYEEYISRFPKELIGNRKFYQMDSCIIYEKLGAYEDLEEQGKLLKIPVVVGDMVWDNDFGRLCSYEVTGFSFGNLNDGCVEEEMVFDQVLVYYTNSMGNITGSFAVSEIGKTVFLTREEAEAALKELEDNKA